MFDLVIKNGTVIDGSGKAGYLADVAVKDGKIACIGNDISDGKRIIDATGFSVTPGFIDSHSHSDAEILSYPEQREKVEQGITTVIGGQCGSTAYPRIGEHGCETFGDFLKKAKSVLQGANIAIFVGHSALRKTVMGLENRKPTEDELEGMKSLLREALENGALGVTFGLTYVPSCYAETDELIALAKVVKEYDGIIAAHIRNEGDTLEEAVEEFLRVIKESGVRAVFSHHKAMFRANYGKVEKTLGMIEKANKSGLDVYCDVYPYTASATTLSSRFVPKEYLDNDKLSEVLSDDETRAEIKRIELEKWGADLSWVRINTCRNCGEFEGMFIPEIAKAMGKDHFDAVFELLIRSNGVGNTTFFCMDEADVERVMGFERAMICTDSGVAAGKDNYHPRLRGSFPRALGRYAREKSVVSLEEMIRKMTSLPAHVYGIKNKGLIKEGYDADICIFDKDQICDKADYDNCTAKAEGLKYVIVHGEIAAEDAVSTGKRCGCVITDHIRG